MGQGFILGSAPGKVSNLDSTMAGRYHRLCSKAAQCLRPHFVASLEVLLSSWVGYKLPPLLRLGLKIQGWYSPFDGYADQQWPCPTGTLKTNNFFVNFLSPSLKKTIKNLKMIMKLLIAISLKINH